MDAPLHPPKLTSFSNLPSMVLNVVLDIGMIPARSPSCILAFNQWPMHHASSQVPSLKANPPVPGPIRRWLHLFQLQWRSWTTIQREIWCHLQSWLPRRSLSFLWYEIHTNQTRRWSPWHLYESASRYCRADRKSQPIRPTNNWSSHTILQ